MKRIRTFGSGSAVLGIGGGPALRPIPAEDAPRRPEPHRERGCTPATSSAPPFTTTACGAATGTAPDRHRRRMADQFRPRLHARRQSLRGLRGDRRGRQLRHISPTVPEHGIRAESDELLGRSAARTAILVDISAAPGFYNEAPPAEMSRTTPDRHEQMDLVLARVLAGQVG